MKTVPLLLAAAGLLGACSGAAPPANDTSPVEANGVEEVMPAEGNLAAAETPANDAAAASTNATFPDPTAMTQADYLGRWVGVEGMYLNVAEKPGGGVTLDMQWDLDHRGTFDGSVTAEGLRFMRNGVAEVAVPSDGDATGLKYLAGKADCLTVKPGEGYCRSRPR